MVRSGTRGACSTRVSSSSAPSSSRSGGVSSTVLVIPLLLPDMREAPPARERAGRAFATRWSAPGDQGSRIGPPPGPPCPPPGPPPCPPWCFLQPWCCGGSYLWQCLFRRGLQLSLLFFGGLHCDM